MGRGTSPTGHLKIACGACLKERFSGDSSRYCSRILLGDVGTAIIHGVMDSAVEMVWCD